MIVRWQWVYESSGFTSKIRESESIFPDPLDGQCSIGTDLSSKQGQVCHVVTKVYVRGYEDQQRKELERFFLLGLKLARYYELSDNRETDWLIFYIKKARPLFEGNIGPTSIFADRPNCPVQTGEEHTRFRCFHAGAGNLEPPFFPRHF